LNASIKKTTIYGTRKLDESFVTGFTNACVQAGGIRLTVELEARRSREGATDNESLRTGCKRIAVTPAYEYAVRLDWPDVRPDGTVERTEEFSTFCRIDPSWRVPYPRNGDTIISYDAHGTAAGRKRQARDLP
jgi:hypothetical protein